MGDSDLAYPVEEPSCLSQYPSPFNEFHLSLLQSLIALIQRRYPLLQGLASVAELVDLGGSRRSKGRC